MITITVIMIIIICIFHTVQPVFQVLYYRKRGSAEIKNVGKCSHQRKCRTVIKRFLDNLLKLHCYDLEKNSPKNTPRTLEIPFLRFF